MPQNSQNNHQSTATPAPSIDKPNYLNSFPPSNDAVKSAVKRQHWNNSSSIYRRICYSCWLVPRRLWGAMLAVLGRGVGDMDTAGLLDECDSDWFLRITLLHGVDFVIGKVDVLYNVYKMRENTSSVGFSVNMWSVTGKTLHNTLILWNEQPYHHFLSWYQCGQVSKPKIVAWDDVFTWN